MTDDERRALPRRYLYSLIRAVPDSFVGEFITVGAIVGHPVHGDWHLRYVASEDHALRLCEPWHLTAVRRKVVEWHDDIAAGRASEEWLRLLHHDHRNLVQLTPPTVVVADSSEDATRVLWPSMVVDPGSSAA